MRAPYICCNTSRNEIDTMIAMMMLTVRPALPQILPVPWVTAAKGRLTGVGQTRTDSSCCPLIHNQSCPTAADGHHATVAALARRATHRIPRLPDEVHNPQAMQLARCGEISRERTGTAPRHTGDSSSASSLGGCMLEAVAST